MNASTIQDQSPQAVKGNQPHIPVMLEEVLAALAPIEGQVIVDCTFGAGGYTTALLQAGAAHVYAFDRDPSAIAAGAALAQTYPDRLTLIEGRFSNLIEHLAALGIEQVDGVVMDIGVSSMQLDRAERGFSFMRDGPLDMRMSSSGPSAADVVNQLPHGELAHILKFLGEERSAGRIASAILRIRAEKPFQTTSDLVEAITGVIPRRAKDRIHPATRSFQALRIFVNRELEEFAQGMSAAENLLVSGGRLVVVSFHSLEDRIAKNYFKSRSEPNSGGSRHIPVAAVQIEPSFKLRSRKALSASEAEAAENPRSRSARLRFGIRTDGASMALDMRGLGVPALPGFDDL
ncbi:MAG: 16S rRNA (cytosine(1402)-N(4))-methyltransferase [Hyphomicrobiales bacterium]|nr:MAG: 16S rRNA (cytosine(1402)-N(4))-methyltransferase [Hyphomicrobiales bacterium]